MNWKQFLKPTLGKIVIFIAFGIISFLILTYYTFVNTCAGGCVDPNCPQLHCRMQTTNLMLMPSFPLLSTNFINIGDEVNVERDWPLGSNTPAVWITSIIYWYILSCLIVWIYGKFRGKKK